MTSVAKVPWFCKEVNRISLVSFFYAEYLLMVSVINHFYNRTNYTHNSMGGCVSCNCIVG